MALLATTLLLLLAPTLASSHYTFRRCNCVFRDNRSNKTEQFCVLDQQHGELSSCIDDLVPRISSRYEYVAPQGLFRLFEIHLRYHHARIFCEQEGGRLAVGESAEVYRKLFDIRGKTTTFWVGLNDMEAEGTWVTVDGTRPPALPWNTGEPNNWYNEDCAEVGYGGKLNDYYCFIEQPFMCERRLRVPIPSGYVWCKSAQIFYKLYQKEQIYVEARRTCEKDGGSLLSVDSMEEVHCALKMFPATWHDPFVDFTDEAVEGQFVNSRGRLMESMDFRRWRPGQPDNGCGSTLGPENCVILVGAGYYEDVSCDEMHPFMCQLIPY